MAVRPKEPEPVSDYVRELITEWEASGKLLKDLARLAKLGTSMPSQIKQGMDVTNYSGPKLAAAWGKSYPLFVSEAYERAAAKKRGEAPPLAARHPDRALAIEMARSLGASEEGIRRVLESHNGPDFDHVDAQSWMMMFLQESQQERQRGFARRVEDAEKKRTERKRRTYQADMRVTRAAADEQHAKKKAPPTRPRRRTG